MNKPNSLIGIIITILLLFLSVSSYALTSQEETLTKLKEFYESAKSEDLDKYVATQDEEYLKIITQNGEYKAYFKAVFELTDIISYEVIDPKITLIDKDRAIIFYELKAEAKITESGEIKKIDNEMVAFLFKYPTGWKVRYTILQELFDDKMATEVIGEGLITANLLNDQNSTTLKKEFIKQGLIDPKDMSYYKTSNAGLNLNSKIIIITLIIIILLIGVIIGFKFLKKKKHHPLQHHK